jgi:hypothetical protein
MSPFVQRGDIIIVLVMTYIFDKLPDTILRSDQPEN